MNRFLVPTAALLWGLQFSFLNPALALLLVALFHASAGTVGWVLAIYNVSGFAASLIIPAYADRRRDYLTPMLACAGLTVALSALLLVARALPLAVIGLLVLGGPAGVGSSLLFAQLKHQGASRSEVVNTRAFFSLAWVAGPPLATFIISGFGNRSVVVAIAVVALLNAATTVAMMKSPTRPPTDEQPAEDEGGRQPAPMSPTGVGLVIGIFVALQATNAAAVSIMTLFETRRLGLPVVWAGVALGVSAGLEIPVLLAIGRWGRRFSELRLVAIGCVAGIAYYLGMAYVSGPMALVGLQVLNAVFFAVVAGVGIPLFQRIIPRPGLASGLYANTRRVGAVIAGPIIALGSVGALGYSGVFLACSALTAVALLGVAVVSLSATRRPVDAPVSSSAAASERPAG